MELINNLNYELTFEIPYNLINYILLICNILMLLLKMDIN